MKRLFLLLILLAAISLPAQAQRRGTPYSWLADGSAKAISIRSAPATLIDLQVTNSLAAVMYVRLYDTASVPTCTSATGIVARYIVPVSTTGAGMALEFIAGKIFVNGIGVCITTTVSDTDNTAVASASVAVSANYN